MLSPKQKDLYWRTWSAVCAERGWKHNDSAHRYALHAQAECPNSMTAFRNADLDKYLAYARRLIGANTDPSQAGANGERRRLLWRIREDAKLAKLDDTYLNKLSTDLYGLGCWDELALDDLTNFRDVIHNRAGKHIGHDTRTRPGRRVTLTPRQNFQPRASVPTPSTPPRRSHAHANTEPDPF